MNTGKGRRPATYSDAQKSPNNTNRRLGALPPEAFMITLRTASEAAAFVVSRWWRTVDTCGAQAVVLMGFRLRGNGKADSNPDAHDA